MIVTPTPRFQRLNRRTLFTALAAGAVIAVAPGCSENAATGRSQLVLVSDEQLAQMSAGAWADVQAKTPRVEDPRIQRRLEQIGARVAEASGRTDMNWEFVAFDSPEINAFVLPGGKVGFFRGLMDLAGGDDEIAAVMGHEAGHVVARHAAERVSQQLAVQFGVNIAAVALQQDFGQWADEIAGALGMGLVYGVVLPYSRKHEYEADSIGVQLSAKSAYDPAGAPRFWRKMIDLSADKPKPLEWLSTHPADDARLEALNAEITKLGAKPA